MILTIFHDLRIRLSAEKPVEEFQFVTTKPGECANVWVKTWLLSRLQDTIDCLCLGRWGKDQLVGIVMNSLSPRSHVCFSSVVQNNFSSSIILGASSSAFK